MVQILLIRPGATDYDQQGRIQGDLDVPLCDQGAHEVARVSEELKNQGLEIIYSSDCGRAVQTAEAIGRSLGVKVKTLDSEEDLKIPAGTQTGTVFRLKSDGMPNLSGRGRGDLFVAVTLVTPKSLTKEQRKVLEQLAQIEDKDFQDESFMDKVRNIFG